MAVGRGRRLDRERLPILRDQAGGDRLELRLGNRGLKAGSEIGGEGQFPGQHIDELRGAAIEGCRGGRGGFGGTGKEGGGGARGGKEERGGDRKRDGGGERGTGRVDLGGWRNTET